MFCLLSLTMTGKMCVICPVSSKTMTEVDMVWVTLPDKAAAPKNIQSKTRVLTSAFYSPSEITGLRQLLNLSGAFNVLRLTLKAISIVQKPTLCVSQLIYKVTNLWKFRPHQSLESGENNGKTHPCFRMFRRVMTCV